MKQVPVDLTAIRISDATIRASVCAMSAASLQCWWRQPAVTDSAS